MVTFGNLVGIVLVVICVVTVGGGTYLFYKKKKTWIKHLYTRIHMSYILVEYALSAIFGSLAFFFDGPESSRWKATFQMIAKAFHFLALLDISLLWFCHHLLPLVYPFKHRYRLLFTHLMTVLRVLILITEFLMIESFNRNYYFNLVFLLVFTFLGLVVEAFLSVVPRKFTVMDSLTEKEFKRRFSTEYLAFSCLAILTASSVQSLVNRALKQTTFSIPLLLPPLIFLYFNHKYSNNMKMATNQEEAVHSCSQLGLVERRGSSSNDPGNSIRSFKKRRGSGVVYTLRSNEPIEESSGELELLEMQNVQELKIWNSLAQTGHFSPIPESQNQSPDSIRHVNSISDYDLHDDSSDDGQRDLRKIFSDTVRRDGRAKAINAAALNSLKNPILDDLMMDLNQILGAAKDYRPTTPTSTNEYDFDSTERETLMIVMAEVHAVDRNEADDIEPKILSAHKEVELMLNVQNNKKIAKSSCQSLKKVNDGAEWNEKTSNDEKHTMITESSQQIPENLLQNSRAHIQAAADEQEIPNKLGMTSNCSTVPIALTPAHEETVELQIPGIYTDTSSYYGDDSEEEVADTQPIQLSQV